MQSHQLVLRPACEQSNCPMQLLLLSKAVVVALTAEEVVLPGQKRGQSGLLAMYLAISFSIVGTAVQYYAVAALISDRQRVVRAECGDATEPLLHEPAGSESDSDPDLDSSAEVSLQKNGRRTIAALLGMSAADTPLLLLAFAAGTAAAWGQALVPHYTGKIIDSASIQPDGQKFQWNILKLLGVAVGCALFTGSKASLFTLAMARLNMRIRTQLFHSLLRQDIGFFDTTKTGEITSWQLTQQQWLRTWAGT